MSSPRTFNEERRGIVDNRAGAESRGAAARELSGEASDAGPERGTAGVEADEVVAR